MCAITEGQGPDASYIVSHCQNLEVLWESDKGFVDAARPVGKCPICEGAESRRRGCDVDIVVAVQISAHGEVAELGKLGGVSRSRCWVRQETRRFNVSIFDSGRSLVEV